VLNASFLSQEGHIPSSLSILDILYTVYEKFITTKPLNRFVLSKGHAALGLYIILKHFNYIQQKDINTFCTFNSILGGHPTLKIPGVEASTGSLGHGFPFSMGIALAKKIKKEKGKVITLIGDGEANEGTIWETALLAGHHKLNNFYCLLDHNHSTDRALKVDCVLEKFQAFGWYTQYVDGHNPKEIFSAIDTTTICQPVFILCKTTKGKGCAVMENNPEWHHKFPTQKTIDILLDAVK
jgi:transketolase